MVKWGENTSFFCALPVKWYEVLSVMRFITQCTSATYYVIAVPCSELVERTIELMPLFVQFVLKYRELFPTMYERCDSNADLANGLCTVQGRNEPLCMVVELSGNVAGENILYCLDKCDRSLYFTVTPMTSARIPS